MYSTRDFEKAKIELRCSRKASQWNEAVKE